MSQECSVDPDSAPDSSVAASSLPYVSPDLVEELSWCMDNPHEIQELATGLMEMENELKCMMDDTSFLQFPSKDKFSNFFV